MFSKLCIAVCLMTSSAVSHTTFLKSKRDHQGETCGEYYARKDDGVLTCKNNGYDGYMQPEYVCSGSDGCDKKQCCYNDDEVETCAEYFARKDDGWDVCKDNGYNYPKDGEIICKGGNEACTAALCCSYGDETCGEYYNRKDEGTATCKNNGYDNYRPRDYECDGQCDKPQCCYNGNPEETCRTYFDKNGNDICDRDGFDTQRNNDVKCGDSGCTSVICCKRMETCKAYFLTYTTSICNKHNQNGPKDSSVKCTTYDGTCTMEDCCKKP